MSDNQLSKKFTTIQVSCSTRDGLKAVMAKNETYESVLQGVIKQRRQTNGLR